MFRIYSESYANEMGRAMISRLVMAWRVLEYNCDNTMLSKGPLQLVLPRLPNTIIRPRLWMHTSWAWVCFQSLNGFTSHILISMTVIHPEYKLVHFEQHWGKDLTAQVTQTVQELLSNHKSSIYTYYYSNIL